MRGASLREALLTGAGNHTTPPEPMPSKASHAYCRCMETWNDEPGVIEFPDGRRVRGTGTRRSRDGVRDPQFAVYLMPRDPGHHRWPYRWVGWRDFGIPRSSEQAVLTLHEAFDRAPLERVEIACGGGIGRTGTALALFASWGGVPAESAVSWVREHYHRRAVETRAQKQWVIVAAGRASSGDERD